MANGIDWARAARRGVKTGLLLGALTTLAACAGAGGKTAVASFGGPEGRAPEALRAQVIPEQDRQRRATVKNIPFNVSLWLRRDAERQFMVQREDLQPMFLTDWSQERAETAVQTAYPAECAAGSLALERAIWDPVGVWVVDGGCR